MRFPFQGDPVRGRMTTKWVLAALAWLASGLPALGDERPSGATPYPARVSENHRYLLDQRGEPFFYLGDTAWELFHRPSLTDAEVYLRDRAAKRFTVVTAVVLAEFGGLVEPNAEGNLPLVGNDPSRPVEAYFRHIDAVVRLADGLGLAVAVLPTWGDKWNKKWGQGPEIFTPENAETYGEFLGRRYRDSPVVWVLGGDRPVETDRQRAVVRGLAAGLARGDGGRHLLTFHPHGGHSSSESFGGDSWLAFNMVQSGHGFDHRNDAMVRADYDLVPAKPCLDGEPGYEDHPAEFDPKNGYLDDWDVRKSAYRALFAGACGHVYGCHDVWQFLSPARPPVTHARTPWRQALGLPGAGQMRHARALLESRPVLTRVPDPSLLVGDDGPGPDRAQATRDAGGAYAMVYAPSGRPVRVDPGALTGDRLRASWFDPRTGASTAAGTPPRAGPLEFRPPTSGPGCDWVLVLDDETRGFPAPGR